VIENRTDITNRHDGQQLLYISFNSKVMVASPR